MKSDGPDQLTGQTAVNNPAKRELFLGWPAGRNPVGPFGANEPLVIGRRDFIADQDKKDSLVVLQGDRDQVVDIFTLNRRCNEDHHDLSR